MHTAVSARRLRRIKAATAVKKRTNFATNFSCKEIIKPFPLADVLKIVYNITNENKRRHADETHNRDRTG